jgi:hypothetical protein
VRLGIIRGGNIECRADPYFSLAKMNAVAAF